MLYEDNQRYISWATKHDWQIKDAGERYHVCCDAAMSMEVKPEYFPTTNMKADMLTNPLGLQKYFQIRKLIPSMGPFQFAYSN